VGGVNESVRFSVRDQDAEALRATLQFYLGYGPAFWVGGVLPENDPNTEFIFRARVGHPRSPATRSIVGDDLVIAKLLGTNQEAMYEFGALQSPADLEDPLMLEFELTLDDAGVVVDAQDWSGVFAGVKAWDKGVAVKFIDDGAKKVEIHSADPAVTAPPSGTYSIAYDWDQATSHIYKLLWYPKIDVLRLYVSTGPDAQTPDTLLIDGLVSDFADLPSDEVPAVQPIGFFGHGSVSAISTSQWSSMHLYNIVTRPVVDGISQGDHEGNLLSDASVLYDATDLPRKAARPWIILPDSFGTIGGEEIIKAEGHLVLRRSSLVESLGFYRVEPKVIVGPTIVDFRLWGRINDRLPVVGGESGLEVYVDDGTKKVVVSFLEFSDGTQQVGFSSGLAENKEWDGPVLYRLIVDPSGTVRILSLEEGDEGYLESVLISQTYATLPASGMPGPGIGFLHNANTVQALAEMFISWFKYSLDVRIWEAVDGVPTSPWAKLGTGSPTVEDDILIIEDSLDGGGSDFLAYSRSETGSTGKGLLLETVCRVASYEKDGVLNPPRAVTGVMIQVDDNQEVFALCFADGGPELGKIAFLATDPDLDQNLIDIRAGKDSVAGTYFSVDWTKFHHYRFERIVSGDLLVFLDQDTIPEIEFGFQELTGVSSFAEGVRFGSLLTDRKSTSHWQSVRYTRSYGHDVEALPITEDLRFEHSVNAIVEVDS
jgi:hypothetical protein